LGQNKGKKDKVTQSKKEKASIGRNASIKGDLSVTTLQSTSSQRKNEKAKRPKKTKASSSQTAGTKGDQSVQRILPVSTMLLLQPSTIKPKEFSSNAIKTNAPDTKNSDGPNVNPAIRLSSRADKLHEAAAPDFEDKEARLHESRGPVFKMGSNTLAINQILDCEGTVVSETTNLTFFHDKTSVDSTVMGESTVFQESAGNVDSKTSNRQMPMGPPKISSVPDPFDVPSTVNSFGDPFAAAASQSNAIPTSESVFFDDNFFSSFASDHVLLPKWQQSGPKPDVVADDSTKTGETSPEMVDTVSSDEEGDVDELAKTIFDEFQNESQTVPSGMTTNQDKSRHAVPASHRESDNINSNSSPSIGKLRAAPSSKFALVADDSAAIGDNAPLEVIDMALSDEEDNVDKLAKTGEAQNELQEAPSNMATSQNKARDPVPASRTESDNVKANSSKSNDKLRAAQGSSLTSPILLQKRRIEKKQRRKQARESPLVLVQKPSDASKCDPSDESTCDPTSTDQNSQTSKGSSSTQKVDETHHDPPPTTTKRHSITSNTKKPQSVVSVSSGDRPTYQPADDIVPDSLVRLHSSIQSERARLIALKQRRNRVGKQPRMSATVSPEKPSQSKGSEKSGDDVVPKDQQPSIVASLRASKSEIAGATARARSPAKPLEKQPESKGREKSADDILLEAQKHSPVAATIASSSVTRSQLKGTLRTRSIAENLQSRRDNNASKSHIPDRKPLQPCSPNNQERRALPVAWT
jgi:hypothetical protein